MADTKKTLIRRPPVIAIMGHIDHGKSTLLDYIRKTNIVADEAGGITQHLSAYEVLHTTSDGIESKITFLDTPGHEAFSAIRTRGVNVADIAILVVSAEDGVKPQTIEALKCIEKENIPYIVAINKIDKPTANIEKTKQNLAENGISLEGWGGTIPSVPISAKTGLGIPDLLDMMILVADLEELEGDPEKTAEGSIIENNMDAKKGLSATLLIKDGTLEKGSYVISGDAFSPVRIMENFLGEEITEATFSSPVRIIGWNKLPKVGSFFSVVATKREAESQSAEYSHSHSEVQQNPLPTDTTKKIVPIIIRTDSAGSADAVIQEIANMKLDERMATHVLYAHIGAVSEADIKTASGNPDTIILAFHAKIDTKALHLADRLNVEIKSFDIIYSLTEWLKNVITERIPLSMVDEITGTTKILKVFGATKGNQVLGGKLTLGKLQSNTTIKILRADVEIGQGTIKELQQQKSKVREVSEGEFGMMIESNIEIKAGDVIAGFSSVKK